MGARSSRPVPSLWLGRDGGRWCRRVAVGSTPDVLKFTAGAVRCWTHARGGRVPVEADLRDSEEQRRKAVRRLGAVPEVMEDWILVGRWDAPASQLWKDLRTHSGSKPSCSHISRLGSTAHRGCNGGVGRVGTSRGDHGGGSDAVGHDRLGAVMARYRSPRTENGVTSPLDPAGARKGRLEQAGAVCPGGTVAPGAP